MCKNLVEKGELSKPLIIFNRTQKRATDFNEKLPPGKTTIASDLGEAVSKADIIFTCLGDDAAIKDTIATAVEGNVKGKLFVDCSTVHPDTTNSLAKTIQAQGGELVAYVSFPSSLSLFDIFRDQNLRGSLRRELLTRQRNRCPGTTQDARQTSDVNTNAQCK